MPVCCRLSATIGIAFSANLLTFFVFYEILTIATYPLIIHDRDEEARIAGENIWHTLTAGQFVDWHRVDLYFGWKW